MSTYMQQEAGREFAALNHRNRVLREASVLKFLRDNPNSTRDQVQKATGTHVGAARARFVTRLGTGQGVTYSLNSQALEEYLS